MRRRPGNILCIRQGQSRRNGIHIVRPRRRRVATNVTKNLPNIHNDYNEAVTTGNNSQIPICGLLHYERPHIAFLKTAFYKAKGHILQKQIPILLTTMKSVNGNIVKLSTNTKQAGCQWLKSNQQQPACYLIHYIRLTILINNQDSGILHHYLLRQ